MQRNQILFGCGVIALAVVLLAVIAGLAGLLFGEGKGHKECVGVLHIGGVIQSGGSGGGMFAPSVSGSETIVETLKDGLEDKNVKAIVVRINSPGGSPGGSQEIYTQIMKMRGSKPIVVSMGDVAASGGYYIAAAGDIIFANPGTLTGSIGVRMGWLNFRELMEKYGVKGEIVKAGKYKDMGSPFREMTEEERKLFEASVNNIHKQFITDVARGRKMEVRDVQKLATGEVFTGEQAKANSLVDRLGGLEDAVEYAARKAGLKGDFETRNLEQSGLLPQLLQTTAPRGVIPSADGDLTSLAEHLLLVPQLVAR